MVCFLRVNSHFQGWYCSRPFSVTVAETHRHSAKLERPNGVASSPAGWENTRVGVQIARQLEHGESGGWFVEEQGEVASRGWTCRQGLVELLAPGTSFWGREWAAASTRGLRDSQDHLWNCQPIIEFLQDWGLSDLHCYVEYSRASHKIEGPLRTNKRQVILPIDYQTSGMSENKDIAPPPLAKSYKCLGLGPETPEPWSLEGALGPQGAPEPLYCHLECCPIILWCASSQVENTSGIEDSKRGVWNRDRRESIELVGGGGAHYWWLLWALCVERF